MHTYTKQQLAIDTINWTTVTSPANLDFNELVIRNTDYTYGFKVRTDAADATTEETISAGAQEVIGTTQITLNSSSGTRFPKSTVVCYVQAIGGTGPLILTWKR